jgi:hypothetical protein
MKYRAGTALAVLLILLAGSLSAHHSASAVFDLSQTFTLTGTLTRLDWRNPHMEFIVEAKDARDQVKVWVIQGASIRVFQNQNITLSDFEQAIGKPLTVEAHPAKEGSRYGALAVKIIFPDGRSARLGVN